MTTLALDAATKTGLAVVRGTQLLHVTGRNSPSITEARELLLALGTLGIDQIAIEAAQARGASTARQGAQAQGTLRQAEWIGLWRAVCRDVFPRVPIVDVYPATWRSGIGMPAGDRKHLKACSLHMARSRWPEHLWTSDDLSDAALLGLYVELRAKP